MASLLDSSHPSLFWLEKRHFNFIAAAAEQVNVKKTAVTVIHPVSHSGKLRSFQATFAQLKRTGNLNGWRAVLSEFCAWMLQGDEEAAGQVLGALEEYARELRRGAVLVSDGCFGDELDFYRAQALVSASGRVIIA